MWQMQILKRDNEKLKLHTKTKSEKLALPFGSGPYIFTSPTAVTFKPCSAES